jgi:hypothetical protein
MRFDHEGGSIHTGGFFYLQVLMPVEDGSRKSFAYDLEAEPSEFTQKDAPINSITFSNFPSDALVYIQNDSPNSIEAQGRNMRFGRYRVLNCGSIQFAYSNDVKDSLSGKIESFELKIGNGENTKLSVIKGGSRPEYMPIDKNDRLEGEMLEKGSLTFEMDRLGEYPLPIHIYGNIKRFKQNDRLYDMNYFVADNTLELIILIFELLGAVFAFATLVKNNPKY